LEVLESQKLGQG
jgi:hypothetical protein